MATAKQSSIRFALEDLAILEEVQRRTGMFSTADALRFVLRQYAQQNGIEVPNPKKAPGVPKLRKIQLQDEGAPFLQKAGKAGKGTLRLVFVPDLKAPRAASMLMLDPKHHAAEIRKAVRAYAKRAKRDTGWIQQKEVELGVAEVDKK